MSSIRQMGTSFAQTYKLPVRVASIKDETLANLVPGYVMDGVTFVAGDRFLLQKQTTQSENGLYVIQPTTVPASPPRRTADANTSEEMVSGMMVTVTEGTYNKDKVFCLTTNAPITLGSSNLVFEETAVPGRLFPPIFGDGADGNVTITSNEVLARDMYYNNLVMDTGGSIDAAGFRIFVRNQLTLNGGVIFCDGQRGYDGDDGIFPSEGGVGGGANGSMGCGSTGGSASSPGIGLLRACGGNGGAGGGASGGAGGVATDPDAEYGGVHLPRNIVNAMSGTLTKPDSGVYQFQGGAGGGGGYSTVDGGGGGGGGGGILMIAAQKILVTADGGGLRALGGNGGDCQGSGNAGGGGGGGGGVVILVCGSYIALGTLTGGVYGGIKGVSAGTPEAANGAKGMWVPLCFDTIPEP